MAWETTRLEWNWFPASPASGLRWHRLQALTPVFLV
jgi:hypothetical protein